MTEKKKPLAIVTGASGGIGAAIVDRLLEAHYAVALWDYNEAAVQSRADALRASGKSCVGTVCDVGDVASVERAAAIAEELFGVPYLLVNNAATRHRAPLEDLTRQQWDREVATNLTGSFQCAQTLGRRMLDAGRGVIVNVSSAAGSFGQPFRGAYSSTKAGLLGLTNTIAVEWGPRGIRCNAVSPGMIATEAHAVAYADPLVLDGRQQMIPARRVGNGDDIADVIVFLASDGARYINGVDIPVDGGWTKNIIGLIPQPRS